MPIPLVAAIAGTTLLGGLGYLLFGTNTPASTPLTPGPLPPAKRPADLPPPSATLPPTNPIVPPLPIPAQVQPLTPPPSLPLPIPGGQLPFIPKPPVTPVAPSASTGTVTAPSGLNLRSAPNDTATVLFGMPFGSRVKILNPTPSPATSAAPNGWFNVTAPNNMTGFASAQFIQPDGMPVLPPLPGALPFTPPPAPVLPPTPVVPIQPGALTATVNAPSGLNMRSSPSTSGSIVTGLFNGSTVTIVNPTPAPPTAGAPNGWYNVQASTGQTGWASAQFLTLNGGASLPATPANPFPGLAAQGLGTSTPGAASAANAAQAAQSALGALGIPALFGRDVPKWSQSGKRKQTRLKG